MKIKKLLIECNAGLRTAKLDLTLVSGKQILRNIIWNHHAVGENVSKVINYITKISKFALQIRLKQSTLHCFRENKTK